jgi:Mn2+/Fe2+ NRAMP family transporter
MIGKSSPLRVSQVIFWSVISAAFIGPGTITTALNAGSNYQLDLIWAVVFSIFACIILQESVSRITIISGFTLGEAIQKKYGKRGILNFNILLTLAVIFGCMAYQAGNITGAVRGIQLAINGQKTGIVLIIFLFAFSLMWIEKLKLITGTLSILVSIMALLFLLLALKTDYSISDLSLSLIQPKIPDSSSILIIGLIGTTIVPYNLFMGSGLSRNRDLKSTRFGLISAILLGGFITVFIVITGTLIQDEFSFQTISATIQAKTGLWGTYAFAIGLFAAGFTSSVTAPLASAITARTLIPNSNDIQKRFIYRLTWIIVLCIGTLFSLLDYNPVLIIILAQVINGLILPFVAISIFFVINDKKIIPDNNRNGGLANLVLILIVGIMIFLGVFHLLGVVINIIKISSDLYLKMTIAGIISFIAVVYMASFLLRKNQNFKYD